MTKRLGTEIQSYRYSRSVHGVPRVMRECHRFLGLSLTEVGIDLIPVKTSERSEVEPCEPDEYIGSDTVLRGSVRGPEDVHGLLLLQPSTAIDFARITAVRRERALPVIASIYDLLPIRRPDWFPPGVATSFRVLLQQVVHVTDHIVVNSNVVANDLRALQWRGEPNIHVLPLGTCFPPKGPRQSVHETIDLLYVSTIEPRKGHARLIEAFDQLQASGVGVRLTLVGRMGWEVDDLIRVLVGHPEFGRSLIWYPKADDAFIAELLESCSVAVFPSEGEGFGLFVEEALSAGTMVVASDLPVFRERPNPNLLYFSGSASSLAATIVEAAQRQPVPLAPGDVRTMRDFAQDLHDLVLDVMDELD